jgi:predicted glycosyltransferase/CheY-like chemotaxis protein
MSKVTAFPVSSGPFALVVDDTFRLGRNLARYLQKRGYTARAVTSVAAANQVITERKPDLVVVDLKLPDASGIDLCCMLQRRFPDLPLIAMSAGIEDCDLSTLTQCGVRRILTKPFPLSDFGDALAELAAACPASACATTTPTPAPSSKTVTLAARQLHQARQPRAGGPRIVLYSHDTMGLGHMRRNILLARSLVESRLKANVLLVSGAREIGRFELPAGIDCLVLPSYGKSDAGDYRPRHLDMETRELVNLRAQAINASVAAYRPDLMIVDNVPRGALHELDPVLTTLNARGSTRIVLGLRDILDAPDIVHREWAERRNLAAVQWHYDQVWVYGDPRVYDLRSAYGFGADFAQKTRFTGYLDARRRAAPRSGAVSAEVAEAAETVPEGPYNLCLVGGGQDGFALARAFAEADQPAGECGLLITGPFMQAAEARVLHDIAAHRPSLRILGFVQEPTRLLAGARRVVAMGGYNTVNEVLAFRRPTLIVPRVRPRLEQLVRARRLAELGHVHMLHPDDLEPAAIGRWLSDADADIRRAAQPIALNGLERMTDYVEDLLIQTAEVRHASA